MINQNPIFFLIFLHQIEKLTSIFPIMKGLPLVHSTDDPMINPRRTFFSFLSWHSQIPSFPQIHALPLPAGQRSSTVVRRPVMLIHALPLPAGRRPVIYTNP